MISHDSTISPHAFIFNEALKDRVSQTLKFGIVLPAVGSCNGCFGRFIHFHLLWFCFLILYLYLFSISLWRQFTIFPNLLPDYVPHNRNHSVHISNCWHRYVCRRNGHPTSHNKKCDNHTHKPLKHQHQQIFWCWCCCMCFP